MYCSDCGEGNETNAEFCIYCGNKLLLTQPSNQAKNTNNSNNNSSKLPNDLFPSAEDKSFYEKWKQNNRISLSTTDILGFIGVFIFGWLLWYVYDRVGKSAWHIFIPIIVCYVIGRIYLPVIFIGLIIYIWAWINIRSDVKRYEAIYAKETLI